MFVIELEESVGHQKSTVKLEKKPSYAELGALLVSGLFSSLTLVDEKGGTDFHISGDLERFGRLLWKPIEQLE